MATRRGLSPRLQSQLASDLGSGRTIHYRKIPGTKARYYDPDSGREVSDHYRRIYNNSLRNNPDRSGEYADLRLRGKAYARSAAIRRNNLWQSYEARTRTLGREPNVQEFDDLRAELTRVRLNQRGGAYIENRISEFFTGTRNVGIVRQPVNAPDGDLARLLVRLGRRFPGQDNWVGMSPEGWVETHMLPAISEGRSTMNSGDIVAIDQVEGV